MVIGSFIRGGAIGFAIAAPVGPIGILVIRRSLAEGLLAGLVTGLGAAVADAFYGSVGAFGITFISGLLVEHVVWTRLLGGAFLCYLGIGTWLKPHADDVAAVSGARHARAFFTTVLLTLANPLTILSFMAVFAGLGLGTEGGGYRAAGPVVGGVFAGSAAWWLLLSGGVTLIRRRLDVRATRWINRVSGACLLLFGIASLLAATRV